MPISTNPDARQRQLANLRTNTFSTDNQPEKKGRNPGSRDRKTIIREWLNVRTSTEIDGETVDNITMQDRIVLAMVKEANNGNVQAFTVLMDGLHGKVPNVQINDNKPPVRIDYAKYTPEQLEQLRLLLAQGMTTDNNHIQEAEVVE